MEFDLIGHLVPYTVILDYQIFFKKENFLSSLIAPESKLLFRVDAAFVPIFPENHKLRYATEWDMNFWKDFYSKTRPDTHQRQMSKGFIQLNF